MSNFSNLKHLVIMSIAVWHYQKLDNVREYLKPYSNLAFSFDRDHSKLDKKNNSISEHGEIDFQKTDNGRIVKNDDYGFSFSLPQNLKLRIKNAQNTSLILHNSVAEVSNEILVAAPTSQSNRSLIGNLQLIGFNVNEDQSVASFNMNGTFIKIFYVASPNTGGLVFTYILTGYQDGSITDEDLEAIFNSIKFYRPTLTLSQRQSIEYQQQLEQQKIEKQRAFQRKRSNPNDVNMDIFERRIMSGMGVYYNN